MLIFFEHLITIDFEINLFWKRKFSGAAALFLTNRYLIAVCSALHVAVLFDKFLTYPVSMTGSYASDSTGGLHLRTTLGVS